MVSFSILMLRAGSPRNTHRGNSVTQDRVPAFPTDEALRRVEASLGLRNFTDVFTLLVDEPVAAASIGQVYKASCGTAKSWR